MIPHFCYAIPTIIFLNLPMLVFAVENKRIMVIAAHPDDIDFGCSGAMALWSGKNIIRYVVCTSGEKGLKNYKDRDVSKDIREKEQMKAAEAAGVKDVLFMREKDGELINNLDFRQKLVKIIRAYKPDILFCPDPAMQKYDNFYLYHPDHRALAHAVFDSVYPAVGNHLFFPELLSEGCTPHQVGSLYFFATENPNIMVDITDAIEIKIKALAVHESQILDANELGKFIKKMAAKAGKRKGMKYAEAFRKLDVPP
jgi:LmbE family N-acetylglucosaminyl deacetylase